MNKNRKIQAQRQRRSHRTRVRLQSSRRPRVSIHRSLKHISAQVIDMAAGRTLVAAHDREVTAAVKGQERAKATGKILAAKLKAAGIEHIVFDKGAYRYHGRVKAFADGMREGGIRF